MPKQPQSKKKPVSKRPPQRGRKPTESNRNVYLGAALIGILIVLIIIGAVSIRSLKNAKNLRAQHTKKEVTITTKENTKASPPQIQTSENDNAEDYEKTSTGNEDIASLVRLVLYDFEIARSAIEERTTKTPKGRMIYHFNVKIHPDTQTKLQEAILSVLKQKGYKTTIPQQGIINADAKKDAVNIVLNEEKSEDTTTDNANSRVAAQTENLPPPPSPSDVVVKLAILLDDAGANYNLVKRFVKIPYPVGMSVLPFLKYSKESAKLASSYGKIVFLHFPMEPKSYPSTDPGEGAVLVSMPELLIDGIAKKDFESLGIKVDGFNNHMGSAITEDRTKMKQIMKIASNYTNVFIDSRTTAGSVAYDECVKAGMKCGMNKRFIDNDNNINSIIEKIYEGAEIAKKNGDALVIGHIRSHTLDALEIALPILEERNITIVPITSVVE